MRRLKRAGEAATSLQAIIAVVAVLGGGALWRHLSGGGPTPQPRAAISASKRSAQNMQLRDQLARPGNRTTLRPGVHAPGGVFGDIHDVTVDYRGQTGPCRITYEVYSDDTNSALPASRLVEQWEPCLREGSFDQDVWVPNPDQAIDAYFVRFYLRDGNGEEVARTDTPAYTLP